MSIIYTIELNVLKQNRKANNSYLYDGTYYMYKLLYDI